MRILVMCDDYYHPARVVRDGLEGLNEHGYTFDFIENAGDWSAEGMAQYPVVLLAKSDNVSAEDQTSWMTGTIQSAFFDFVRTGHGLLAVHSGTAGYAEKPLLRALLGGIFDHHPQQCPVTVEPDMGDPLAAGSSSFTQKDEHYFMAMDDAQAAVFLKTISEHGVQPGGWTRFEGQGRVCVLTPGHNIEVWKEPSFQVLLRNALKWCGEAG
jgi:type 1 glutamine amidotransferase